MMMAAERTAGPGLGLGSHKNSKAQFQSQTTQNLHGHLNKSFLSSGTSGTKKKSGGPANRQVAQTSVNTNHNEPHHSSAKATHHHQSLQQHQGSLNHSHILNTYNTSQMMSHLSQNMQNIQRNDVSLKMTQQNLSSNFKPLAGPSGPSAPGPSQLLQGGAQSTTASTTGAGHFLSGKSIKNRKMGAGGTAGASGQGPAGASGATNIAGKRRASINNHRQQQQFFANQQPGQFVNFEQM